MIRFLILAGYFELSLYLTWSGKLDHYINLHYSYLAYLSMALTFLLALIQLRLLILEERESRLGVGVPGQGRLLADWFCPFLFLPRSTSAIE